MINSRRVAAPKTARRAETSDNPPRTLVIDSLSGCARDAKRQYREPCERRRRKYGVAKVQAESKGENNHGNRDDPLLALRNCKCAFDQTQDFSWRGDPLLRIRMKATQHNRIPMGIDGTPVPAGSIGEALETILQSHFRTKRKPIREHFVQNDSQCIHI